MNENDQNPDLANEVGKSTPELEASVEQASGSPEAAPKDAADEKNTAPDFVAEEAAEPEYPTSDVVIHAKNVFLTSEAMINRKIKGPLKPYEMLPLPEVGLQQEDDIRENNPQVASGDTENKARWQKILVAGDELRPVNSQYEETLRRENSRFCQGIETEKGLLSATSPSHNDGEKRLNGDAALLRVRAVLGQGSVVNIPLVHSGFWISIRSPSDGAIIELRRQLMEEKIRLGRSTHGLIMSNATAYSNKYLLDMCMDHMYSTTLKETDVSVIRSMIKAPDLQILFWGLACAIYPTGFEYVKALLSKDGIKEGLYETGLVDLKKSFFWVDNNSLADWQRRHMANRQRGEMTHDAVLHYQKSMRMAEGRVFELKDNAGVPTGIKIELGIPSAKEYIASGEYWIQGLVDIIERVLTGDRDDERRRNGAIFEHARVTELRQYSHWVKAVYIGEHRYDELEWLAKFLDSTSENEESSTQILTEIKKYIDDCTVGLIAIPSSNGDVVGPDRFPRLIPIDAVTTFFTLFIQRANRLTQ